MRRKEQHFKVLHSRGISKIKAFIFPRYLYKRGKFQGKEKEMLYFFPIAPNLIKGNPPDCLFSFTLCYALRNVPLEKIEVKIILVD